MRLKKLGAALVVAAALGAVLASSALAAAVTEDVQWYTGAAPGTELSGSETMSAEAVETGTFTTEVGTTKYKLQSKKVSCVECKIENSGGVAVGSGKLKFEEVSVVEPAGCKVASSITTTKLSVSADWMSAKETEPNYIKFVPAAGEETAFATVEITECALETTIVPKGSVFVKSTNATGTQAVEQEVASSEAINKEAGGSLKVGTKTAVLAAKAKFKMSGAKAGQAFGTKNGHIVATTKDVKWYTGAAPGTELSSSETMSAEAVETGTFTTEVGTTKYKLQSKKVSCVECKIENSGGVAVGSGKLKFEEVSVVEPAGCSVASSITTTKLSVSPDWMIGTNNYIKFVPAAGEETAFATVEITGCALETTIIPKGSVFVQSTNATEVQAVEQEVTSSEAINNSTGGSLKVGTKNAVLAAKAKFKMSGAKAGTAFGTH